MVLDDFTHVSGINGKPSRSPLLRSDGEIDENGSGAPNSDRACSGDERGIDWQSEAEVEAYFDSEELSAVWRRPQIGAHRF